MKRYPELDLLRTLALLGMIIYHTAFDLAAFYSWDIDVWSGGWKLLARSTAILFLLLVGISFTISWDRNSNYQKQLLRAVKIIGAAMLITIATFIAVPDQYIRFGILHLIGVSALLLPFFAKFRSWNLLIGFSVIFIGNLITDQTVSSSLLLPLGFKYPGFVTLDYFPLLPWLGVILIGIAIGDLFYVRNILNSLPREAPAGAKWGQFSILNWLTWPGRHSLLLYLIHQPIIIAILWIILGPWQ